ncbi:MAG: hypothetical protein JSW39_23230 [Desulfobacterales bacterium]|nr:MAG: hypothetical protein JSW39_23230 [Desulfobacterales bacterium]
MVASVHSSISALQAFGRKLGVTADNIANVNTDGFKKNRASLQEGLNGDVRVEISRDDTPGHPYQVFENDERVERETSNVDLTEEIPNLMTAQRAYEANLTALQTQGKLLDSLLDIVS